jgi:CRP/FNR family transcriptional regulator, cyclic AMP receptor protein
MLANHSADYSSESIGGVWCSSVMVISMRKALYVLGQLNDDDIEWMLAAGKRERLSGGTPLVREGEPIDAMYLLLDGQLSVTTAALGNRELAHLAPGEIVGEMSFVDARPPSATVTALHDSTVFVLDRASLSDKLARDVGFAARFYRALAVLLSRRMRTTVGALGYLDARMRLADASAEDEIDPEDLNAVHLAGARFDRILKQ